MAEEKSEAMMALAEASTSTNSLLTQGAPGNWWLRHINEFAQLSGDLRVIQTRTEAGFMKPVTEGENFKTVHDEENNL